MNRVISINLNGNAYQLEEPGYELLHDYLERAAEQLADNPDREEILADIEQAIAEKLAATLSPHKSVVLTREVTAIIGEMGPVQDESAGTEGSAQDEATNAGTAKAGAATSADGDPVRRLYKIREGAVISGVCNGFGAYFDVDVVMVRIVFVLVAVVTMLLGLNFIFVALGYGVLALALPSAATPQERAAARGDPATAQEFIRRARKGYYEGLRSIKDPVTRRKWKRQWQREFRRWRDDFRAQSRWAGVSSHWHPRPWTAAGAPGPLSGLVLLLVGLAEAAVVVFAIIGVALLVAKGSFLGYAPPADVPIWVVIVLFLVALQLVLWPLKLIRHGSMVGWGGVPPGSPETPLIGSLVGLLTFALVLWIMDRYVPFVHNFLHGLPEMLRHLFESVQAWWQSRSAG